MNNIIELKCKIRQLEITNKFLNDFIENTILTKSDLNKLLQLCHPDKHDNSNISNEMTKKLLKIKQYYKIEIENE